MGAKIVKGTRSLVFSKVLNYPLKRSQEHSTGTVLNFMLVDSENASRVFGILPQLIQLPVMIVLGIYTVYISVGLAFIGVAITIIIVAFLMSLLTKATNRYFHSGVYHNLTIIYQISKRNYAKERYKNQETH